MTADEAPPRLLPGAPAEADRMYAVVLGYWSSQVAGTLARLAVPDLLAERPRTVDELAAELGVTGNQLVLAWLLHQRSPRVLPLIGPRTREQFEDALPALDVKLSDEQLARLDRAGG